VVSSGAGLRAIRDVGVVRVVGRIRIAGFIHGLSPFVSIPTFIALPTIDASHGVMDFGGVLVSGVGPERWRAKVIRLAVSV
jgi:hypothetical protein